MFTEAQLLPLSALQHYLFCPRQCALIHVEQQWAENRFTAEGNVFHKRAHDAPDEARPGVRITRSLPVRSFELGVSGQCDVVEFHNFKSQITNHKCTIVPIEYKRGKPKAHRADEVQLCAQAICIEEMLNVEIHEGFLFYGQRKRRTKVPFDTELRQLVATLSAEMHSMFSSGKNPPAEYEKAKCNACSLIEICQPNIHRLKRGADKWFQSQIGSPELLSPNNP